MELNNKKYVLEAYGLIRIVLGVAQIVGLFSAYFLLEFIVNYPKNVILYVIDEDLIALVYLAILFRGIFHLISGIGIARCRNWIKVWLYCGWAVMSIITYGLIFTLCSKWIDLGYISGMSEAISPLRLFIYLSVVFLDLSFVCKTVSLIEGEYFGYREKEPRLEFKKIFAFCFMVVVFFALLLYLGKPISKGFHKGYYKTRGDHYTKKPVSVKKTSGVKSYSSDPLNHVIMQKKTSSSSAAKLEPENRQETKATFFSIGEEHEVKSSDGGNVVNSSRTAMQGERSFSSERSFPYHSIIGYAGSFCLAVAFLLQAFDAAGMKTLTSQPLISFVLFCVGFVFLFVYGISLKLTPITILSLLSFIICVGIICLKVRSYDHF
ncbi:MAG: hypothetical protein KKD07_06085 [Candidatus Omnitrophica bacterium]|nr:hypothetical protein [Candidatus Omnitrophota bacterium]MBU1997675.1 hypothetical protein [Candidatus Omnitrophota bacterium]MBU4333992.1 hypothetical protein [Candidatus Omnitrophota bacterium]